MSNQTKIQWCDATFNPWIGCTEVSPGCLHCYAKKETFPRVARARGRELWGKGAERHRTSEAAWKAVQRLPAGSKVFCASMADWLDEEVSPSWLEDLLQLIHETPKITWLLLTKRPQNFFKRITHIQVRPGGTIDRSKWNSSRASFAAWLEFWRTGAEVPKNVWFGVSVEDQTRANERIPILLQIPARIRFLSVEPMLGPIIFPDAAPCEYYCDTYPDGFHAHRVGHGLSGIQLVIFGGESGPGARRCSMEWIADGLRQCQAAGVAAFVKQMGSNVVRDMSHELEATVPERMNQAILNAGGNPITQEDWDWHIHNCPREFEHKKGGEPSEWPESFRVRQFPSV